MNKSLQLAMMGIKRYTHKGVEILKGLYPNNIYTIFVNGDDLAFKTLKEAKNYIDKHNIK